MGQYEIINSSGSDICLTINNVDNLNIDYKRATKQNILQNRLLNFKDRIQWSPEDQNIGSEEFARRTAEYQLSKCLKVDGIMGLDTWIIRGRELGIDARAEHIQWMEGRIKESGVWEFDWKLFRRWEFDENAEKSVYMEVGRGFLQRVFKKTGLHHERIKQMQKDFEIEMEKAWNERGDLIGNPFWLELVWWIRSGETEIIVNLEEMYDVPIEIWKPNASLQAPVPWTLKDLENIKKNELEAFKQMKDPEPTIDKMIRRARLVYDNWENRYGKWFDEGGYFDYSLILNDNYANLFYNFSNISDGGAWKSVSEIHYEVSPYELYKEFKALREELVSIWETPTATNPMGDWNTDRSRYNNYIFEYEARDPTSVEFNFEYEPYKYTLDDKGRVDPPLEAQTILQETANVEPKTNKELLEEIDRLYKLLKSQGNM